MARKKNTTGTVDGKSQGAGEKPEPMKSTKDIGKQVGPKLVDPKKPTAAEQRKLDAAKKAAAEKARQAALPKLVRKPFRHVLGVKCTDAQYMAAGKEVAACRGQLAHIAMVLSEAKKKAAADSEPINTRMAELFGVLDTGERQVDLKCERVLDYKGKRTQFVRKDTGEVFHERQMNHDEQQREFSFFHPQFDIES